MTAIGTERSLEAVEHLARVRDGLLHALGPLPARVPLEPLTVAREDTGPYWRELVEYAVEPGERVRAYLLVPKDVRLPRPAVLCHHQNNNQYRLGKSEVVGLAGDPDQAYAHELAARGFVCLAPDALGFEERHLPGWEGWRQHVYLLGARLLQGQTLLAKQLGDLQRAIDLLIGRLEVDPRAIGMLGHSFGGGQAIFAAALDKRIAAVVDNCGTTSFRTKLERGLFIGIDHLVPGLLAVGDVPEVIGLIAPRPFLLSSGRSDPYSTEHAAMYRQAAVYYAALGYPDRIVHREYDTGHAFTPPMRAAAYAWLERWLGPAPPAADGS